MPRTFIKLSRVCVPLTLECDLNCRYCYRKVGRIPRIPDFTDSMREFLWQLDPLQVQAVVASGGEPLLRWDKVQELFSYCRSEQHKRLMTNGLNLSREIVEYVNKNNIEVLLSHDGAITEWTRGHDILKDPEIKNLVQHIDDLTVSCVCTAKNPDPYANYLYTKSILKRDFYFHTNAVLDDRYLPENLVDGFDYDAFFHGRAILMINRLDRPQPPSEYLNKGVNVLPDGRLVGMECIHHTYGTIYSTDEEVWSAQRRYGDRGECSNSRCPRHKNCAYKASQSEHFCRVMIERQALREAIHRRMREEDAEND